MPLRSYSCGSICFYDLTNLKLTLKHSNDPFLFEPQVSPQASQLKEIAAEQTICTQKQVLEYLIDFCAASKNFWEIACPSGIGTLQQEKEVLLRKGSMSFDRRSLDVTVAWQQQLPRLKWLETIGLLSRCMAIINSSHQGLCCSYCWFSHKRLDNNKTAGTR